MKNLKIKSGLLAFVFGLVIVFSQSAFKNATNPNGKNLVLRSFYYHGPTTYAQAEVEDESNWSTSPNEGCNDVNQIPCLIRVDESFVDNPSSPTPTLKATANIQASLNSPTSSYYVSGSDDPSMEIDNKTK